MADPRYRQLAETLVSYSCALGRGEKVLIEAFDVPHTFTNALVGVASEAGAQPIVWLKSQAVQRRLMHCASEEQMRLIGATERSLMEAVDAYIGIRGSENVSELADVPAEGLRLYESKVLKPVHFEVRVPKTRWVVLRWPSPSMAQLALQSTEAFEDFYFRVCTMDYARLSRAMRPLIELLDKTREVRLVAPGTDLTFSVEGIPAVACDGHRNIPDGEVFTAPVRESIQGTICFNAPSIYQGVTHEGVRFTFRDGKIVDATSSNPGHLAQILDTDEGARYAGEFAIGLNPFIEQPMKDILFDEKIAGSIHLTPGNCYDEASNGNRSQIHWDLVLMMGPSQGGGEVHFDGRLVRKDGEFVLDALAPLNPSRLAAA